MGHRIARQYGGVSKMGYSPFSWGRISQMPQIYQGFGIDVTSFYRGVNTLVAPKSEFALPGRSRARWRRVSRVSLEEAEQEKLAVDKDGWVKIAITGKKIMTLKFWS